VKGRTPHAQRHLSRSHLPRRLHGGSRWRNDFVVFNDELADHTYPLIAASTSRSMDGSRTK
jgi:hypothetical protein